MASVTAMRELALLDLDDLVSDQLRWTHSGYPGASVSVVGFNENAMTVRFALWLISTGVRDMLHRRCYELANFVGQFRGRKVGYATFKADAPRHPDEEQISNSLRQPPVSISNSRTIASLALEGNDDLQAEMEYLPSDIDRRDIFLLLVYLLMALASRRVDEPLMAYLVSFAAITSQIRAIWNGVLRQLIRRSMF